MREMKIHVWELPNGFTVYTRYDDVSRLSGFGARVGHVYDPPGQRGMTHLFEHIISRESEDFELDEYLHMSLKYWGFAEEEEIETEMTHLYVGHTSMNRLDHMMKAMPVYATFLRDRLFDRDSLKKERAAMYQELHQEFLNDAGERLTGLVLETMYEHNPIREGKWGLDWTVPEFDLQKVRQFGRRYFTPSNMFMIMLGPSHERAKNVAHKYFGHLAKGSQPRLDYDHSDDVPVLPDVRMAERGLRGTSQFNVSMAWPVDVYGSKSDIALEILARILEMRLYIRLREENSTMGRGVYSAHVEVDQTLVHGIFVVSFATTSEEFSRYGHDVVLQEVRRLKEELVPVRTFDAAVTFPEQEWLDAFRYNANALANKIVHAVANGDVHCESVHTYQDELRRLNRARLREAANRYLKDEYVFAIIRPE